MKKFILLMVLSIISILFAACGGSDNKTSSEKEVAEDKTYVVGVDNTYPPFEFEADGKLVGIDIDLIHAIAEDQGFNIKIEQMDFSGIIPSMQAGELDIGMGGMSITDERKKQSIFPIPISKPGFLL